MGNSHSNSYIWEEELYKQAKAQNINPENYVATQKALIIKRFFY